MRFILVVVFLFLCARAFALDNSALLGKYELATKNKQSELQTAEVVYNDENKLVVRTDRNDMEYELTPANGNGVVYEGDDEPNCDGDEEHCYYDSATKIVASEVGGVARLSISITVSDAWVDDGSSDETTTYELVRR